MDDGLFLQQVNRKLWALSQHFHQVSRRPRPQGMNQGPGQGPRWRHEIAVGLDMPPSSTHAPAPQAAPAPAAPHCPAGTTAQMDDKGQHVSSRRLRSRTYPRPVLDPEVLETTGLTGCVSHEKQLTSDAVPQGDRDYEVCMKSRRSCCRRGLRRKCDLERAWYDCRPGLTFISNVVAPNTCPSRQTQNVEILRLAGRRMHIAMRPNRALRPSCRGIVDDAISVNREIDHAVPCLE